MLKRKEKIPIQKFSIRISVTFLLIIIVSVAMFGLSKFTFTIDKSNGHIQYADNEEELKEYFYNKTPGLKRAEKGGNFQIINKEIMIPDSTDTLTLDSIWYSTDRIYVFYHIEGKRPSSIDGYLAWNNQRQIGNHLENMNIGEGIIYNGNFYSRLTFGNQKEWNEPSTEKASVNIALSLVLGYGI